ncbi:MAG: hypothetical protein LBR25_07480 [Erysipelotrichaceae bacterium]|jgi:hypothetical protein|nr:hypothetical protein [Erysipelotrichaceae bacterium]
MKKTLVLVLSILLSLTLTSCSQKKAKIDSSVVAIEYAYGGFSNGYYEYAITTKNDQLWFRANGYNGIDLFLVTRISDKHLEELTELINDQKIYEWNGYAKYQQGIYDGYSFSLTAEYANGEVLHAEGYEMYPDDYDARHKALADYFAKLVDLYLPQAHTLISASITFPDEEGLNSFHLLFDYGHTLLDIYDNQDIKGTLIEVVVDDQVLQDLEVLVQTYNLDKWTTSEVTFIETPPESYSFLIEYADGDYYACSDGEGFADNYEEGKKALMDYFLELAADYQK